MVPVPLSVPGKSSSDGSGFWFPVRFLGHPANGKQTPIGQGQKSPIRGQKSEGVKCGMGWVVVGTVVFWGAPILHLFVEKRCIFQGFGQNRGAPKTALHTNTHPSPHLTASERMDFRGSFNVFFSIFGQVLAFFLPPVQLGVWFH